MSFTSMLMPCCLASALLLVACQPAQDKDTSASAAIVTEVKEEVRKGLDEARKEVEAARQELATENLSLNRKDAENLPKAEITPAGDLLIDGKAVTTTPEQKALVLAYRAQLLDVVGDGMAIGMEGAQIGIDTAAAALKGALSGQSGDEVGKQAEAAAEAKIKPMVEQLCKRLPGLLAAQQTLASALPEFKPYATLDQSDVDDCKNGRTWSF